MFRILFGAALASCAFYAMSTHPEWVHRASDVAREQIAVARRNYSSLASHKLNHQPYRPEERRSAIDRARVGVLAGELSDRSSEQLWQVMNGDDYDRRAAAAQILLARNRIPATSEGIDVVRRRYLRSRKAEDVAAGFSYLGLLALQGGPASAITELVQGYVERRPQDRICDNALWALGELGTEEARDYFLRIIEQEQKYGPVARERAFCCLVQCGRYSPAQRFELIPTLIDVAERGQDPRTRAWALQGLGQCAPGVACGSLDEWKAWWAAQS
jgi:hypothetical protein